MKKFIIHPRRKFIIRPQTLPGMEEQMCLDEVKRNRKTGKLQHSTTNQTEDNVTQKELLEKVRGTGAGRGSIPDDGWVEVEVEDNATLTDMFGEAQKQKSRENFV